VLRCIRHIASCVFLRGWSRYRGGKDSARMLCVLGRGMRRGRQSSNRNRGWRYGSSAVDTYSGQCMYIEN
jgi:hypothetical protein